MTTEITLEHAPGSARKRVAAVAHGMLSGEVTFLKGATELAALRSEFSTHENDPDFQIFSVIVSQIRNEVPPAPDLTESRWPIVWEKQMGISACQSLVRRFHD